MKNKQVKQMICSVLNRSGGYFGYYSLCWDSKGVLKVNNSYALRYLGSPCDLTMASVKANIEAYTYGN